MTPRYTYTNYDSLHDMTEVIYRMWLVQMKFKLRTI